MFKKINFYQLVITIVAVLFASALVVYGWTAPAGEPPGNDVPSPINTGADGQIKQGGLSVGSALGATSTGFSVLNGNSAFGTTTTKDKGAGTFGFLNTQDVWLRDANGGTGAWASTLGGSGGIDIYQCPRKYSCDDGQAISGDWASYGCIGQISSISTCTQIWWTGARPTPSRSCNNNCIYVGKTGG